MGCGRDSNEISKETFIDVVVALRETERELRRDSLPEDSAVALFEIRKAGILEEHRTNEDQVRAFVNRTYADLELQTEVWETISERLKYLPPGDSVDAAAGDPAEGMLPPSLLDRRRPGQGRLPGGDFDTSGPSRSDSIR